MIYSMTGFGRVALDTEELNIVVEVKALNGRNFEVVNRFPTWLRSQELEIRTLLKQQLHRGSIDIMINLNDQRGQQKIQFNHAAAEQYYRAYKSLAASLGQDTVIFDNELLIKIASYPEVSIVEQEAIDEKVVEKIHQLVLQASQQVQAHRLQEGNAIANDLRNRTHAILSNLEKVEPYEEERINTVRERMEKGMQELQQSEGLDANRFEQELIHYIERLDISEEKQRLITHCQYFLSLLDQGDVEGIGKKLGFMSQEMGREINTLGSKANHTNIQKLVVQMKDELEKIKEQILNVL